MRKMKLKICETNQTGQSIKRVLASRETALVKGMKEARKAGGVGVMGVRLGGRKGWWCWERAGLSPKASAGHLPSINLNMKL